MKIEINLFIKSIYLKYLLSKIQKLGYRNIKYNLNKKHI